MQYTRLKVEALDQIPGHIHSVISGTELKSLEIELGGVKFLIEAGWNDVKISQETPDEIETRYQVEGAVNGFKIAPEVFQYRSDADKKAGYKTSDNNLDIVEVQWNVTKNKLEA